MTVSRFFAVFIIIIGIPFFFQLSGEVSAQTLTPPPSPEGIFESSEAIYFWRINEQGESGIFISRETSTPEQFTSSQQEKCVGCHTISNRSGKIAFVLDTATGPVAVHELKTGQEVEIPTVMASYLAWSPDGEQLAISYNDEDIYLLDIRTGNLLPLDGASEPGIIETMPDWSPDGKQIAFVRSETASDGFDLNGDSEIAVISAKGGSLKFLTEIPTGRNYYPSFSPDGRWVAFTHHADNDEGSYASQAADIYLIPSGGGQSLRLDANSQVSDSWPSWSADSQWLAFNSKRNGEFDIFVTHINANGQSGAVFPFPGANTDSFEHLPAWGLPPEITATPNPPTPSPSSTPMPPTPSSQPTETVLMLSTTLTQTPSPSPLAVRGTIDFCLGPISLPCSWLNLPWWICPLILILLLSLAFLLWLWQRREQRLSEWSPPEFIGVPSQKTRELSGLDEPRSLPKVLPQRDDKIKISSSPQIVIGVGETGWRILEHTQETLRETPQSRDLKLLAVHSGFINAKKHKFIQSINLPIDEGVQHLAHQLSDPIHKNERLEYLRSWYSKISSGENGSRSKTRLAIWHHSEYIYQRLDSVLSNFIDQFNTEKVHVHVICEPSEVDAAIAFDVTHILRLIAQELDIAITIYAGLVFSGTIDEFEKKFSLEEIGGNAFAFWRELDRFQSAFAYAYPFPYPDRKTYRDGKLFERVILFSPDRNRANLTGIPLEEGLYPAIADALITWSDSQARQAWEEIAHTVDTRQNQRQALLNEPLYSSLGIYSYILPINEIIDFIALRFEEELLQLHVLPPRESMREIVLKWLSKPEIANDVSNTCLIQSIARWTKKQKNLSTLDAIALVTLLVTESKNEATERILKSIHQIKNDLIPKAIPTSAEFRSDTYDGRYGPDTKRVINETEAIEENLSDLKDWIRVAEENQQETFSRLLREVFNSLLSDSSEHARSSGTGRVVTFSDSLAEILIPIREDVVKLASEYEQREENELQKVIHLQGKLEALAKTSTEELPSLRRAIYEGFIPALTSEIVLGFIGRFYPVISEWLWIPALGGVIWGVYWSFRKAFPKQQLPLLQERYQAAKQKHLEARVDAYLSRGLADNLHGFENHVEEISAPFRKWKKCIKALLENSERYRQDIKVNQKKRRSIQTRKYLDDADWIESLFHRHIRADIVDDALSRLFWTRNQNGTWELQIISSKSYSLSSDAIAEAHKALFDLCSWYLHEVRELSVADVLHDEFSPEALCKECDEKSTPMIGFLPHEQTEAETHRILFVQTNKQQEYFDTILRGLQAFSAKRSSQRLATISNPYRMVVLNTLDLIRRSGITRWEEFHQSYRSMEVYKRIAGHVFPAESNAERIAAALRYIGQPAQTFSPRACLTLENVRRARAFWLAYSTEIIRIHEQNVGIYSVRSYSIFQSDEEPVPLTQPKDSPPDLWDAVTRYVVSEAGGDINVLESSLKFAFDPKTMEWEDILEHAIDQKVPLLTARSETKELGQLLHLFLLNELHIASGSQPIIKGVYGR